MAPSETARKASETSAEPIYQADRWSELAVCEEVVLGDLLERCSKEIPLLTEAETAALDPALLRVARERRDARQHYILKGRARTRDEVERAALAVEEEVQSRLWALGGPGAVIAHAGLRASLWQAQYQAHQALFVKTWNRTTAKAIQVKAAAGRKPLTVCRGRRFRRLPENVLRKHAPDLLEHYNDNIVTLGYGDGCGGIILDSSEPRTPKLYCKRCSDRAGNTMNAGLSKTARKRLIDARKRR